MCVTRGGIDCVSVGGGMESGVWCSSRQDCLRPFASGRRIGLVAAGFITVGSLLIPSNQRQTARDDDQHQNRCEAIMTHQFDLSKSCREEDLDYALSGLRNS